MDQQAITCLCGAVLVTALALSYYRYRRHKGSFDASSASPETPSVKETLHEVSEYFGFKSSSEQDGLTQAFDLAPVKLVSDVLEPKNSTRGKTRKRGE